MSHNKFYQHRLVNLLRHARQLKSGALKSSSHPKYYAVSVGHEPGIYRTWTQVKTQIDGVHNAQYRLFDEYSEARKYISDTLKDKADAILDESKINALSSVVPTDESVETEIKCIDKEREVIYIDGACDRNGKLFCR